MIRSLVIWVFVLQTSFLFASVQRDAPDTVLPGSIGGELPGIVIKRKPALGKSTGDTVHFQAGRFLTPGAFRLEDLVKNIPGFRVDDNGRIYFNGKEINRIMIDGDDIAGEQYQLLSRNLKALMVDSLQVIHRFEKNRLLRTVGNQDAIAVNLVIKKSFLGKLNGSLALSKDPGKHGEAEAELIRLMQSSKQLFFANGNNIGGNGVADRGDETASTNKDDYRIWPFEKPRIMIAAGLPSAYVNPNKDMSLAFVSSFAVKRHVRLRISSTAVHKVNKLWSMRNTHYQVPAGGEFLIQSATNELNTTEAGRLRFELETDRGANRVSAFRFTVNPQRLQVLHAGTRSGITAASSRQDELRANLNWHAIHQVSWKIAATSLLRLESKMAVDRNKGMLRADYVHENSPTVFIGQFMVHNGRLFSSDLALISDRNRRRMRNGFTGSLQNIRSSIGANPMELGILKFYPYTDLVYRLSKKVTATLNAASGAAIVGNKGTRRSSFIFQVDQQWVWQRKPIEKYHLGFAASRKNSAPKQWHDGPFVFENALRSGVQALTFPVSISVEAGMTKMDLYKGYTIAITATASLLRNDYGLSTNIGAAFDSLAWFIVPLQENLVFNGYAEQFIHLLKLKYTINVNGMVLRMPQVLNGNMFNSTLRSMGIEQRVVSNWKGIFNAEFHVGLFSSSFHTASTNAFPLWRTQYGLKAGIRFHPKLFTQLHCALYKNGHQATFVQCDGMFRAKISSQWSCSMSLSNLLNNRQYQENSISAYGNSMMLQALNGRRILFGLHWGF